MNKTLNKVDAIENKGRYVFGQCFGSRYAEYASRLFGESGSRSGFLIPVIKIQKSYSWKKQQIFWSINAMALQLKEKSPLSSLRKRTSSTVLLKICFLTFYFLLFVCFAFLDPDPHPRSRSRYTTESRSETMLFPLHFFQEQLNPLRHCMKINLSEGTRADVIHVPLPFLQEQLNPLLCHLVDENSQELMNLLIQRIVDDKLTSVKAPQQTLYLSRSSSFRKSWAPRFIF
jgi:hypothetical protein